MKQVKTNLWLAVVWLLAPLVFMGGFALAFWLDGLH